MLRLPAAILAVVASIPLFPAPQRQTPGSATTLDTIQAGDPRVEAARLRPFAVERRLTLSRGDTVQPFGRQLESLAPQKLDGRPVLLGVVTFETPRGTTVDSSWLEAATLRPIRMRSTNAARRITLGFDGDRVRSATKPSTGVPESSDRRLGIRPFEWNMFGLALSALPLRPGFRAAMPVYIDRFERAVWYRGRGPARYGGGALQRPPRANVGGAGYGRLGRSFGQVLGVAAAPVRRPGASVGTGGGDHVCPGSLVVLDREGLIPFRVAVIGCRGEQLCPLGETLGPLAPYYR